MSRKHQFGNLARLCRRPQIGIAIALAILLIGSSVAHANTCYWTNNTSPGGDPGDSWGTASNWSTNPTLPASGDYAYIDYGGTATVDVTTASLADVFVGTNNNASYAGVGTLYVVNGGSLTTGALYLGYSGYSGSVTQTGGTVSLPAGHYEVIGSANGFTGVYSQSGGSNTAGSGVEIGYGSSCPGCAYYLSGSGTLTMISGTVLYVGDYSPGLFSQTGGLLNATGVGTTIRIGSVSGIAGSTFTQSAGTTTATAVAYGGSRLSGAGGTYNLNGGLLTVGAITVNATAANFNLGGGTLQWANAYTCTLPMALTAATTSTIDVQNYAVTMSGALTGGGSLTVGTGTTTGTLTLSSASNTYSGLTTVGGGTLAYGVNNAIPGAVTVSGGVLSLGAFSGTVTRSHAPKR